MPCLAPPPCSSSSQFYLVKPPGHGEWQKLGILVGFAQWQLCPLALPMLPSGGWQCPLVAPENQASRGPGYRKLDRHTDPPHDLKASRALAMAMVSSSEKRIWMVRPWGRGGKVTGGGRGRGIFHSLSVTGTEPLKQSSTKWCQTPSAQRCVAACSPLCL